MPYAMLSDSDVTLSAAELRSRCAARNDEGVHETFCFELFRRAIVERDARCWEEVYDQYKGLVVVWLCQLAPTGVIGDNTFDDLVVCTFTKLWRFYAADQLAFASGLASILAYLKTCAVTCVQEARRAYRRLPVTLDLDAMIDPPAAPPVTASVLDGVQHAAIWQVVAGACQDDQERVVARLCFTVDLKPAAIYASHPELFDDVAAVYRVKRNLLARLERNATLRALWAEENC